MIRIGTLALALLALWMLAALPLAAQQDDGEKDPVPQEQPSDPAPQQDKEPPEGAPKTDDSPFDYRSSEKISEDLSVSFPVDI